MLLWILYCDSVDQLFTRLLSNVHVDLLVSLFTLYFILVMKDRP